MVTFAREHDFRGAVALLWSPFADLYPELRAVGLKPPERSRWRDEILLDGPAGTGKTFATARFVDWLCRAYPGVRILVMRETLRSLRASWQRSFETEVLYPGHPALSSGGSGQSRVSYDYHNGVDGQPGSIIDLGGLDNEGLWMSTQYDVIIVCEATNRNIAERHWVRILTRLRGVNIPHPLCRYPSGVLPDGRTTRQAMIQRDPNEPYKGGIDEDGHPLFFNCMVADCNPSIEFGDQHWLWKRFKRGAMIRLRSKHADNPSCTQKYLEQLDALPGKFRDVYYLGAWSSVQGRVWPAYDSRRHLQSVEWHFDRLTGRRWLVMLDWLDDQGKPRGFPVQSVIAGYDWGVAHAGSMQVLAVTPDRMAVRVAEVYSSGLGLREWGDWVKRLVPEYGIESIRCSPERPDIIEMFNRVLGEHNGIAQAADNRKVTTRDGDMGGLDLVNEMFAQNKLFLARDALLHPPDSTREFQHLPLCLADEIVGYVKARDPKDPERWLEIPDKRTALDDGCDALRYACADYFWRERTVKPKPQPVIPRGYEGWVVPSTREELEREAREKMLRIRRGEDL